jgi:hypothetical protein
VGCQPCEAFAAVAPATPLDGDLWIDTSAGPPYQLKVWSQSAGAWRNVGVVTGGGGGGGGAQAFFAPFTAPPAAATWSWINQATATIADVAQGVYLQSPFNSNNLCGLVQAAPATPWTRAAVFALNAGVTNPSGGGLWFRESSSGKLDVHYFLPTNSTANHELWNSPTSFNSTPAGNLLFADLHSVAGLAWVRLGDDGTNRTVEVSSDGLHWFTRATTARTSFLTANQVGFFVRVQSAQAGLLLLSWT